jgi:hypothetical protein
MLARLPQVGVDEQDALTRLGQRHREIRRHNRFPLDGLRAGDHDGARPLLGGREYQVRADAAEGLGEILGNRLRQQRVAPRPEPSRSGLA